MADVQKNGLSEEALERIKFSFSSKNAENVVAPCLVDVYMAEDPRDDKNASLSWQLVTTGVVALLRNRESTKKGWIWNISVAIADRFHGMCVWRDRLSKESSYTVMSDTFHVFSVNDIQAITAFVFESPQHGRHFGDTYKQWVRDKLRDDGFKGKIQSGPRFRRDMISRPCNFQHISGSAALAQIQQMEDAKQAVGKVISTIGRRRAISLDNIDGDFYGGGGKRHKKKDHQHNDWPSRFEHMNIPVPNKQQSTSGGLDLMYSQEPGAVQDNTAAAVTMEARVVEQQQPIHSNGVSHNHHVTSSSSIPQYHHQQYAQHQNGGQQINYAQQQYFEEEEEQDQYHHENQHSHQHSYQQDQGGYHDHYQQNQSGYHNHHQQDQGGYHNHQHDQSYNQDQPDGQEMKYEVEDIGYDYDDDMLNEPTEHYWRQSIMEGTNWEDEIMKAWKLHGGATSTTDYS